MLKQNCILLIRKYYSLCPIDVKVNLLRDIMGVKKTVLHIGPISSHGGMSKVMKILINNPPEGWQTKSIDTFTHSNPIVKIISILKTKIKVDKYLNQNTVDILHVHVTHGISWWRKLYILRRSLKNNFSIIIHIHSGKFDKFCIQSLKIPGKSFKKIANKKNVKVVVLENRWKDILSIYSSDLIKIENPVERIFFREKKINAGNSIKLLLIARNDPIKGHIFAEKIYNSLIEKNMNVELTMTGSKTKVNDNKTNIRHIDWLESDKSVRELIKQSDFLLSPSEYEGSSMSVLEAMSFSTIPLVSIASKETVGSERLVMESWNHVEWANRIQNIINDLEYDELLLEINLTIQKHAIDLVKNRWKEVYKMT
jgi:glycosyltransferase involved in cell wall biosynthesis